MQEVVVSIPYPVVDGMAQNIYTFVLTDCKITEEQILKHCKNYLPEYMIPKKVLYIKEFPLNVNGKTDTKKLEQFISNTK